MLNLVITRQMLQYCNVTTMKPQKLQEQVNFATYVIQEYDTETADNEDKYRASILLDLLVWEKQE